MAHQAGVSKQTVSRVINNKSDVSSETRQHVIDVIKKLDYRPNSFAQNLAANRNILIGLVVSDVNIPLFPDLIRAVETVANQNQYSLVLKTSKDNLQQEREALIAMDAMRVDGVIVAVPRLPDDELMERLKGFKAVVIINYADLDNLDEHISVINVESYQTMTSLVEGLIEQGRRNFAYVNAKFGGYPADNRQQAFIDTLKRHNLYRGAEQLFYGDNSAEIGGYHSVEKIMQCLPDTDAIVAFSDLMAIGVLKACAEHGISVPDDVAVTGFDDSSTAAFSIPALTTARVDRFEIGVKATENIFDRLKGNPVQTVEISTPELIWRDSTLPKSSK